LFNAEHAITERASCASADHDDDVRALAARSRSRSASAPRRLAPPLGLAVVGASWCRNSSLYITR